MDIVSYIMHMNDSLMDIEFKTEQEAIWVGSVLSELCAELQKQRMIENRVTTEGTFLKDLAKSDAFKETVRRNTLQRRVEMSEFMKRKNLYILDNNNTAVISGDTVKLLNSKKGTNAKIIIGSNYNVTYDKKCAKLIIAGYPLEFFEFIKVNKENSQL